MVLRVSCIFILGVLLASVSVAQEFSEKEKAAISDALKWLTLIDDGKYSGSWNDSAECFKSAVKKEQWVKSLQTVRKPLGNIISREIKGATYTSSLPGAPDGHYVVIQFRASFENKKSAVETVTPMLDKDGNWRVSGYYIK